MSLSEDVPDRGRVLELVFKTSIKWISELAHDLDQETIWINNKISEDLEVALPVDKHREVALQHD